VSPSEAKPAKGFEERKRKKANVVLKSCSTNSMVGSCRQKAYEAIYYHASKSGESFTEIPHGNFSFTQPLALYIPKLSAPQ